MGSFRRSGWQCDSLRTGPGERELQLELQFGYLL